MDAFFAFGETIQIVKTHQFNLMMFAVTGDMHACASIVPWLSATIVQEHKVSKWSNTSTSFFHYSFCVLNSSSEYRGKVKCRPNLKS